MWHILLLYLQFFRQYEPYEFSLYGMLGISSYSKGSFKVREVYRGYIDDQRNTDNAWIEAEIWHFHYPVKDSFDEKIKEVCLWNYTLYFW